MVAPVRYLSRRTLQQQIGIIQNTEDIKVLEVVGRAGIGTTIFEPTKLLDVRGEAIFNDKVIFDSTNSIQIPVGTTAERDLVGVAVTGQIRYNTTNSSFEGYGPGGSWGSLGEVKDVDGDTYILTETQAGSDEDTLYFYTGGILSGTISTETTTFNNDLEIKGDFIVQGDFVTVNVQEVLVEDKNIILGFTTTITPNDTTANGGGISIASTEGNPLIVGLSTYDKYKQFSWHQEGSFTDLNTDAWISNYAISIGSTSLENGVGLGVGTAIRLYNSGSIVANSISASGIVSATQVTPIGFTTSLTTVSPTPIYSISTSSSRSVEYDVQAVEGNNYLRTKINALHDGSTAYHTEYGTIYNNISVASFDVDVSGGNMRLVAIGNTSDQIDYTILVSPIS
jgi:hypothetical protein